MNLTNPFETFSGRRDFGDHARFWLYASAILFIVVGIAAIAQPFVAGYAITMLVGWLLIFGGVMHAIGAIRSGSFARTIWQITLGIAYAIVGVYFLSHPLIALGTLTLLLAGLLFAEAVLDFAAYFAMRHEEGSGWLLFNGAITLLLSLMIGFGWPLASVWAIGTLFGINLIANGVSRLMLGGAVRDFQRGEAA
jgi:uncharacterized membrane protein HdeD (DUF308 family)